MFFIIVFVFILIFVIIYDNKTKNKHKNNISNHSLIDNKNVPLDNKNIPDTSAPTIINKEYKLAGVTYKNEEGKDIQKEIKKILNEYIKEEDITKDDMFLGYTNTEIKEYDLNVSQFEDIPFEAKIEEGIFDNKPCVKVYMKRADMHTFTHIGYIPKRYNQIEEVLEIMRNNQIIKVYLNVVGGKIKSCEVEEDDEYNEHYYVETTVLDYGLRLFIKYQNTKEALLS